MHIEKADWFADTDGASPEKVGELRQFFSQLLFNGAVMEYDGGMSWYDVHPVIQNIDLFKKAVSDVPAKPAVPANGS